MYPDRTGRHRLPRAALALCALCLAVVAPAGCGGTAAKPPPVKQATLILDFVPNAVHAGIYRALAAGYYREQGIDLRVVTPSASTDTLKLIDARSAQFGLADGSDVAGLIAQGGDAQAVMAIVQRPLGGLIASASERLRTPAGLQGRTVGITGVPSDTAVLDTEVRHAGGDPRRVHVVTIGFNGAQALAAHRIDAFTGFIPDDGVQLQVSGHPITAFALDRNGGPAYPGLVAFTTRGLIASDPALVRGFVAATVHGYEDTLADPARSLDELLGANPTLQPKFTRASLRAYLPLFAARPAHGGAAVAFGTLQPGNVRAMSNWMLANRLIAAPVSPTRYGTDRFVPGA
jgi:NitT/TauT family transport system substrate-binding protein/putative hydroxymethylpyrimidine transport system substrate-binding protein